MKILIIGSGAREYAIGKKIYDQRGSEVQLYFAPGNAGTELIGKNVSIPDSEIASLLVFSQEENIDYTIVGPEAPLVEGIADVFERAGKLIFAPSKEASQIEGSKEFCKTILASKNIPTAKYKAFKDADAAIKYAKELRDESEQSLVVLKADGLAAGKGVLIVSDDVDIENGAKNILENKIFGDQVLLVEEYLEGFETSLMGFFDGESFKLFNPVRDHKTIYEGNVGPNTGGMGTFTPDMEALMYRDEIKDQIIDPFIEAIKINKIDYRGIVFFGLMITKEGPKVLEINTRFGDPETQVALMALESDLLNLMMATSKRELNECYIKINDKNIVNVVAASGGYPGSYEKGYDINGLDKLNDVEVFYAGVKSEDGKLLTNGGRVLSIAAADKSMEEAERIVYSEIERIEFKDMYYRKDIAPNVKRIYVNKKDEFDIFSEAVLNQLQEHGINPSKCKLYKRYDIEGLTNKEIDLIKDTILREPPVDDIYVGDDALSLQKSFKDVLVRQYKAGQFDQRERGLIDTIKSVIPGANVAAHVAEVISFEGVDKDTMTKIKKVLINPVDEEEGRLLEIPSSIKDTGKADKTVVVYEGFKDFDDKDLAEFYKSQSLAMDLEDLKIIQDYFKKEGRDINDVELSMIDTYWSDHCRHTTFNTALTNIKFESENSKRDKALKEAFEKYLAKREEINRTKPVSLMDLGTIHSRYMRHLGKLDDVEVSDEINACTLIIDADVDGEKEEYLFFFKNETHNHPTEIEPFGGAQTCLGGAIRDPLSGRGYVYQAMRITGASDPINDYELKGKLTQKKIVRDAAKGYSSYGNQIGLATGYVEELFHPGYKAKRMEVGAVVGAAPRKYVKRENPEPGDVIVLLGGRTGRDGVGGATGSSKSHDESSVKKSGAEVQKGHAPTERKIQRLFRRPEVTSMIKKCNDFGAGGVSVAIGELADSLDIYLDRVPLKYKGLTPREIAISESQERMAVVIRSKDLNEFLKYAEEENLEATHVADVVDTGRMKIFYHDDIVVDLSREFLNSTGAEKTQDVTVEGLNEINFFKEKHTEKIEKRMAGLDQASRKNLLENFDFSVGRASINAPLGGKNELTPINAMAAKIPSKTDLTRTTTYMSYGFIPYLSAEDPFVGSYYSVLLSVFKLVASGAPLATIRTSYQEYFEKMGDNPKTWQKPFIALLGALKASSIVSTPPIGGKDSMSGTFEDLNVPPTLISFAVGYGDKDYVTTSEMKGGHKIGLIEIDTDEFGLADDKEILDKLAIIEEQIQKKNIKTSFVCDNASVLEALIKMCVGNDVCVDVKLTDNDQYKKTPLTVIIEYDEDFDGVREIGKSGTEDFIVNGEKLAYEDVKKAFVNGLNEIYGTNKDQETKDLYFHESINRRMKSYKPVEKVRVVIPVFEGTNSEFDSRLAFEKEGAYVQEVLIKNLTPELLEASIKEFALAINNAQILFIPGGFSMSDEPDGSAKFISNVLRNKDVKEAIEHLVSEEGNDGLVLGVCNGFQALIKTGLLPFGQIKNLSEDDATLTFNTLGRHISRIIPTKPQTLNSPWLKYIENKEYRVPISHGEGRFYCSDEMYKDLVDKDQVAFKYVINPNGSSHGIESIMDPSGKILGKMGHSERVSEDTYKNIPDIEYMNLFKAGVEYFK